MKRIIIVLFCFFAGCIKNVHPDDLPDESGSWGTMLKKVRKAMPYIHPGASVSMDKLDLEFQLSVKNPSGFVSAVFRHTLIDPIVRRIKSLAFRDARTGVLDHRWLLIRTVYNVEIPLTVGIMRQTFFYDFLDPQIREQGDWWFY